MYRLKALYRFVLLKAFRSAAQTGRYDHPDQVGGYRGWYELPRVGVVAFIRDDGSVQYRW